MKAAALPNEIGDFHALVKKRPKCFGKDIKLLVRHVEKLLRRKDIFYKPTETQRVIAFCESFRHYEGRQYIGQNLELAPEQRYFCACVFGIYTYNEELSMEVRYHKEGAIFVARKWGKSFFISAIGAYMLMADGEPAAQVWCLATQKQQATIVYSKVRELLRNSIYTPTRKPKKYWHTRRDADNAEYILFPETKSFLKAGSKNSKGQDGLNPHCYIIDELHAIEDRNTYDVFSSATGSRAMALGLIISTFGYVREGIFDSFILRCEKVLHGESGEPLFPMIFRIDEADDYGDENCWIKANPQLGKRPTKSELRKEFAKVGQDPSQLPSFLAKHLNRASATSVIYFSPDMISRCSRELHMEEVRGHYAVTGVDMAETTDLCCASIIVPIEGKLRLFQKYFIAERRIAHLSKIDKMAYQSFTKTKSSCPACAELLQICEGSKINKNDVVDWLMDMAATYDLHYLKMGHDRWHADVYVEALHLKYGYGIEDKDGYGIISDVAQGVKTLSSPMKETRALFEDGIIEYDLYNGLFRWCCTNTSAKVDSNNNVAPNKARSNGRIDGYVAFLIAYVAFKRAEQLFINYQGWKSL